MALDLSATSPLFKRIGKTIFALKTLNTARLTTVPAEILDIITEFNSTALALHDVITPLPQASVEWQRSGDSLFGTLQRAVSDTIIQMVKADNQQESDSIEDALDELIRQMVAGAKTIQRNALTTNSIAAVGSPNGNGSIILGAKYSNGRNAEFALSEELSLECTNDDTAGSELFSIRGELTQEKNSQNWPGGSGASISLRAVGVDSRDNLIINGSFEIGDDQEPDSPNGWIRGTMNASLNAPGVTITPTQQQVVVVSGTHVAGVVHWWLNYDDGVYTYRTEPLDANADAGDVQGELNKIPGLELVTVAGIGAAPNLRHIITMTGVPILTALTVGFSGVSGVNEQQSVVLTGGPTGGTFNIHIRKWENDSGPPATPAALNIPYNSTAAGLQTLFDATLGAGQLTCAGGPLPGTAITVTYQGTRANRNMELMLTSVNALTGGASPAPAYSPVTEGIGVATAISETTSGLAIAAYRGGRVLRHDGDGATSGLLVAQQLNNLEPKTTYAYSFALKNSTASPASGVLDMALVSFPTSPSALDDDEGSSNVASIALTAIADTDWHFYTGFFRTPSYLTQAVFLQLSMNTFLTNGRRVYIDNIVLTPATQIYTGGPFIAALTGSAQWRLTDKYTGTIVNDRNGEFHEWFQRLLDIERLDKMLPSAAGGAETIPDSLIA